MNRMEEYNTLMQELEETPERLNFTVARAKARTRRQKIRRYIGTPAAGLAAVCLAFVMLVNASTPFAMACAKVPVLKDLAAAVAFSASLSAAVENDWVQPVGQTARDGEYTMTVEYVIVDQKQLNIFYRLEGGADADSADWYMVASDLLDNGEELPVTIISNATRPDGELHSITADFTSQEGAMPGQLRLECELRLYWDESERADLDVAVAKFAFDLSFDPKFTQQGKVIELNRWLELDGERLLLKSVEIYPTHMRLNWEDDPENTAWLRGLDFYVEDEDGNRFEAGGSSGLVSTGSPDTPFTDSYRVESAFFVDGEELILYITGAKWLEKDRRWTWVDLTTGETGWLPDEVTLLSCGMDGDDGELVFRCRRSGTSVNPFTYHWKNAEGEERTMNGFSVSSAVEENPTGPDTMLEGYCDVHLSLDDPGGDRVELEFSATQWTQYDKPVEIPVS